MKLLLSSVHSQKPEIKNDEKKAVEEHTLLVIAEMILEETKLRRTKKIEVRGPTTQSSSIQVSVILEKGYLGTIEECVVIANIVKDYGKSFHLYQGLYLHDEKLQSTTYLMTFHVG